MIGLRTFRFSSSSGFMIYCSKTETIGNFPMGIAQKVPLQKFMYFFGILSYLISGPNIIWR